MHYYRLNDTSLVSPVGQEAVIALPDQALITTLNRVGSVILFSIQEQPRTLNELINLVINTFEVDQATASRDTEDFLNDLVNSQIVFRADV